MDVVARVAEREGLQGVGHVEDDAHVFGFVVVDEVRHCCAGSAVEEAEDCYRHGGYEGKRGDGPRKGCYAGLVPKVYGRKMLQE